MFGNLGQMMDLMKRAGDIRANIKKMREESGGREYHAASGGELVQVTVTGDFQVKSIRIAPEALADRELLEDLLQVAFNNALQQAKVATSEALKEAAGGLDLEGML